MSRPWCVHTVMRTGASKLTQYEVSERNDLSGIVLRVSVMRVGSTLAGRLLAGIMGNRRLMKLNKNKLFGRLC